LRLPFFFPVEGKMRINIPTFGLLLLASAAVCAQVASHAPTGFKQMPGQVTATLTQPASDQPVVRVNGTILTQADLVREEYTIFPYARQHNGLPKDLAPQIRDGALKMIIFEELVYQEALRRKMAVPAAKVQRAEAAFRKQFATPQEFNAIFQSEFHGSEQLLQQKIQRSLMIEAFLKTEVAAKSIVSDAEVRSFYGKNPVRFEYPESFIFQSISILPPAKPTADQLSEGRKRAADALRQAKSTKTAEEFGLLAEKISDDDYRVMMGQHKSVPAGQLPPPVVKALSALKPGDVSNLLQIDQAFTIVRLQEHVPEGKKKFEDVKVQLAKELQQVKTNQVRAALDTRLRQNAKIEEL
jgi:parvulin-like peptidyl-prolyl isomerase